MRRMAMVAGLALALGCGDEKESVAEQLQGTWQLYEPDGICGLALVFEGDRITTYDGCELEDDSVGFEVTAGDFKVDGDELSWTADRSSCADAEAFTEVLRVEFVDGTLRLTSEAGIAVLERKTDGPSAGAGEFGCWDEEGFFEPGDLQEI
jgi:hypothetical protein